ncbi:MAG: tetratricopeptide repeat protein [Pyrinomonadaceae bacterium]
MKSIVRVVSLTFVTLAACFAVSAQDLGSANKLFGSAPKAAQPTTKRSAPKKVVAAHKQPTRTVTRHAASKTSATHTNNNSHTRPEANYHSPASNGSNKAQVDRSEVVAPTGTKITKPFTDTASASTRFADQTIAPTRTDKKASKPLSPVDEARLSDLIRQGNSARDSRDYTRAESAYKNARYIKPRDERAIYGLGNIYSDQQRWEEAENAYRAALQVEPASARTLVALSYVLTQPLPVENLSDRYAEAEKLARRATELAPNSAPAYDQLGVAMEMRGEIGQDTESVYRKAVTLDPTFAPAYAHLGKLLRQRGMTDRSQEAYRQATERSTDIGMTLVVAGVMQGDQHYAESIPLLHQIVEADPKNPTALLMLGHALTVTGQYKDAETALQKALALSPNRYQASALLASLYMRQRAYELAENALLQAVRWAPAYEDRQLAQQFVMLGQGYSNVGKSEQSRRAYAQAAKLDPDKEVSDRIRH